jgi:hypothetical protein
VLKEAQKMTDFTFDTVSTSPASSANVAKGAARTSLKTWLVRIVEAMSEARRLQAETMVKNHLYGAY